MARQVWHSPSDQMGLTRGGRQNMDKGDHQGRLQFSLYWKKGHRFFCPMTEQSIKDMKKETFKTLLKKKLKEKATEFLFTYREKHSKTQNLKSFKLQTYLSSNELTTNEKKLLFSLRTRSIDVKRNYKNKFKFNMLCSLCKDESEEESEPHLLRCSKILSEVKNDIDVINAKYGNIFSDNIEDQVKTTKIFSKVLKQKSSDS